MYNNIKYKKIGGSVNPDEFPALGKSPKKTDSSVPILTTSSVPILTSSLEAIPTYIQTEPNKEIFVLSDIHGDIHSLIIVLRDLAQVIRKKISFSFNNDTYAVFI